MPNLSRRGALGLGFLAFGAGAAGAQGAGPARIRGTIVSLEGNVLTVTTREGGTAAVTLGEPLTVRALRRVALADVTAGTSVGVVAEPGSDGELRAVAITVLPPGATITQRQVAWDLAPNTSMNDGPVEAVVEGSFGRDLTLTIMGRSVKVRVSPETPMVMPIAAARTDLVAGATVFINGTRNAEGQVSASVVTVSKDGVSPPI